jgi:hypothetical protein
VLVGALTSAPLPLDGGEEDLLLPLEHPETAQATTTAVTIAADAFTS